jgi:hypothetical protein
MNRPGPGEDRSGIITISLIFYAMSLDISITLCQILLYFTGWFSFPDIFSSESESSDVRLGLGVRVTDVLRLFAGALLPRLAILLSA